MKTTFKIRDAEYILSDISEITEDTVLLCKLMKLLENFRYITLDSPDNSNYIKILILMLDNSYVKI